MCIPLELTRLDFKRLGFKRRRKAAAAAAGLAGIVALAFAFPAFGENLDAIDLDPGMVPTTAEAFTDQDCAQIPAAAADWLDGWVFVLPESVPAKGNFVYVEAVFRDEDGNVLRYDTEEDGGIVRGAGDDKAFITAPADLELIDAEAHVELERDGKGGMASRFDLARTCPAAEAEPGL